MTFLDVTLFWTLVCYVALFSFLYWQGRPR
jgi:hypothetical protein